LAWCGARAGEGLLKDLRTIWTGCSRHEIAGHQDCRPLGKPQKRLLEIRPSLGTDLEAELQAVDKSRAAEVLDLIGAHSVAEVTLLLRRSATSIRAMLHRLGASARMGQDWFSKHSLAEALHVRSEEVQKW